MLNCGLHPCPQHCHQLSDHSKMLCERVIEFKCSNNHSQKRKCHKAQPATCNQCELDDQRRQRELQAALCRQDLEDKARVKHDAEMTDLDRQIQLIREQFNDSRVAEERARALIQKRRDLERAKQMVHSDKPDISTNNPTDSAKRPNIPASPTNTGKTQLSNDNQSQDASVDDIPQNESGKTAAELEWDRQKRVDNAANDAIDTIMGLTGLENVKMQILQIKAKTEILARQGASLSKERLGMVLLGNPGTGKVVSRSYTFL
jgi:hypothetical protein